MDGAHPTSTSEITAIPLAPAPEACPYLAGLRAEFEHYLFLDYDEDGFCRALEAGFRHFGSYFFRPACPGGAACAGCGACVPVRVRVEEFQPSRSQRRVLRKGEEITFNLDRPRSTEAKFEMYRKHKQRFHEWSSEEHGAGDSGEVTREGFNRMIYEGGPYTWECSYFLAGRLIGAGVIDVAPRVLSSIYFYFDTDYADYSPGTLSILNEIALAQRLGIPYYYLGYAIWGNPVMRYKMDFRPCEYYDGAAWRPLREGKDFLVDPAALRTGPYKPFFSQ